MENKIKKMFDEEFDKISDELQLDNLLDIILEKSLKIINSINSDLYDYSHAINFIKDKHNICKNIFTVLNRTYINQADYVMIKKYHDMDYQDSELIDKNLFHKKILSGELKYSIKIHNDFNRYFKANESRIVKLKDFYLLLLFGD